MDRRAQILSAGLLTLIGLVASAAPAAAKGSLEVVITGGDLRRAATIPDQQLLDLSQQGSSGQFPIWGLFRTAAAPRLVPSITYQLQLLVSFPDQKEGFPVVRFSYYPAMGARSALARVRWFDSVHSPTWRNYADSWLRLSPGFEKLVNDTITSAGGSARALGEAVPAPIGSPVPLSLITAALVAACAVVALVCWPRGAKPRAGVTSVQVGNP